ncbi:hypothetical protein PanWU01x14_340610, partial [Parasponia andersonii]
RTRADESTEGGVKRLTKRRALMRGDNGRGPGAAIRDIIYRRGQYPHLGASRAIGSSQIKDDNIVASLARYLE